MSARACEDCCGKPVMRCGRCATTRCAQHALASGTRCEGCEQDWADESPTRRSAKLLVAPPAAILAGGILFGLLLPVSIGGVLGAMLMSALVSGTAVGVGTSACRVVDRSARALFLRERGGQLPPARLLTTGRR